MDGSIAGCRFGAIGDQLLRSTNQCHAMRLRSGLSLTKGLSNSLGIRSSRKKSNCARNTVSGFPVYDNFCREAAWGWAMHTLDCHVELRPKIQMSILLMMAHGTVTLISPMW